MCIAPRNLAALVFGVTSILPLACNDSTSPKTGSIKVTVTTVGQGGDRDPDGYLVRIDGESGTAVGINAIVTIANVPTGSHLVLLDGVEANCTISGTNPRPVDVSGSPIAVAFFVSCGARTGTIMVSTVTSGPEPDNDGYTVVVGGNARGTIPPNGTLTIGGVEEGQWGVSLSGVSLNCTVDAPLLKLVNVELAKSVQVSFTVRCVPTVSLRVTASTTGVDLDSNGYSVLVQIDGGSATKELPTNGTVTVPSLAPGNYVLSLLGPAPNCDPVIPRPQTVAVFENPTNVTLEVVCEKARQLAFVDTFGNDANIHVINSNDTGNQPITSDPRQDVDPAWSPDGSKIAFASKRDGNSEIYSMDPDGANPVRLTLNTADDFSPAWSPNGAKIVFVSLRDGNPEIYVMDADGSNQVRLLTSISDDINPAWSPDGKKIAFSSNRDASNGIWVINADGSGLTRLTTSFRGDRQPAWSPDGTRIAFSRGVSANVRDIFTMNPDGSGLTSLTQGALSAEDPAWSLDGRRIAFGALACDAYYYYYYCDSQILVVGLDGTMHTPLTTANSATNPTWRP